ncbi:unnamed protein product [Kuraishia capsulata CBS 1993]|uniref:Coiled-coil domain-containing protein n=1 Tax=Kuraishia capsulata CBS 1993 TaxID=1382522 RepID=W6MW06_9ASCO|nr:uncharacterized protein KUCA_T00002704001 [Kuraishia capsulata CBS 1993]CDK26730.1 unnamed protein product [Kuraishia capsulata CBS 1993]
MAKAKKGKSKEVEEVVEEEEQWEDDGPKKGGKKLQDKAQKRAEELEKKKQREELLKMEEESTPSKKAGNSKKAGQKYKGGIDDALNSFGSGSKGSIEASGIDDALGALSLISKDGDEIDRHPERRVKAALAAFSERRLPEIKSENPGLRKQQLEQLVYKEFQKSPENPMNQVSAKYNAKQEDVDEVKAKIRKGKEMRYQK